MMRQLSPVNRQGCWKSLIIWMPCTALDQAIHFVKCHTTNQAHGLLKRSAKAGMHLSSLLPTQFLAGIAAFHSK